MFTLSFPSHLFPLLDISHFPKIFVKLVHAKTQKQANPPATPTLCKKTLLGYELSQKRDPRQGRWNFPTYVMMLFLISLPIEIVLIFEAELKYHFFHNTLGGLALKPCN